MVELLKYKDLKQKLSPAVIKWTSKASTMSEIISLFEGFLLQIFVLVWGKGAGLVIWECMLYVSEDIFLKVFFFVNFKEGIMISVQKVSAGCNFYFFCHRRKY